MVRGLGGHEKLPPPQENVHSTTPVESCKMFFLQAGTPAQGVKASSDGTFVYTCSSAGVHFGLQTQQYLVLLDDYRIGTLCL